MVVVWAVLRFAASSWEMVSHSHGFSVRRAKRRRSRSFATAVYFGERTLD
jgi:hypothetical protein